MPGQLPRRRRRGPRPHGEGRGRALRVREGLHRRHVPLRQVPACLRDRSRGRRRAVRHRLLPVQGPVQGHGQVRRGRVRRLRQPRPVERKKKKKNLSRTCHAFKKKNSANRFTALKRNCQAIRPKRMYETPKSIEKETGADTKEQKRNKNILSRINRSRFECHRIIPPETSSSFPSSVCIAFLLTSLLQNSFSIPLY